MLMAEQRGFLVVLLTGSLTRGTLQDGRHWWDVLQ